MARSDFIGLKVHDVAIGGLPRNRAAVMQRKTKRPVQFEIGARSRELLKHWLRDTTVKSDEFLFSNKVGKQISTWRYARIVKEWIETVGLDPTLYATHTMRRTKVTKLYRKTGNLRAVQLLLGHSSITSTVQYLGVEVEDALLFSEEVLLVATVCSTQAGGAEAVLEI